jgi:hypothetical protein
MSHNIDCNSGKANPQEQSDELLDALQQQSR